jgi:hypothetical protein
MSSPTPGNNATVKDGKVAPPTPLPPSVHEIPKGMDLINHVAKCLDMGCDPLDIQKQLRTFGFPEENAEKMVTDTIDWMRKNPYAGKATLAGPSRSVGFNGHMIVGIIACIIGIGVTGFSFLAAGSSSGSGRYIVAWGAILFGIVEILRGFGSAKQPDER